MFTAVVNLLASGAGIVASWFRREERNAQREAGRNAVKAETNAEEVLKGKEADDAASRIRDVDSATESARRRLRDKP